MLVNSRHALRTHQLSIVLFLTVSIIAFMLLGIEIPRLLLALLLLAVAGLVLHARTQMQELVSRVNDLQIMQTDLEEELEQSLEAVVRYQVAITDVQGKSAQLKRELHEVRESLSSLSLVLAILKRRENIADNGYLQRMEARLTRIVLQFSRMDTCLYVEIPQMQNSRSTSTPTRRQTRDNGHPAGTRSVQAGLMNASHRTFLSAAVTPVCAEVD